MTSVNHEAICDVCGSDQFETVKKPCALKVPLGPEASYNQTLSVCKNCGEATDITPENERTKAIAVAEKQSLESMINFIVGQGNSLANIERALDLPPGTISRWKSGQEPSAAGLTLLRFIRVYPWLLDV